MEQNKKKTKFELSTKNDNIKNVLEVFKENQKLYFRMLEFLKLLGNFDGITDVELYEKFENKEKKYIKVWISDLDDNIFVLTPCSTFRNETFIVEKLTNDNNFKYDLLLAKKFNLTKDNIDLTQTEFVLNFKFGRLITNNKSFFNLFLSDNLCYQIKINNNDDSVISSDEIIQELNKLNNLPKFSEFIDLFGLYLKNNNSDFKSIDLGLYKNFERVSFLTINEKNSIKEKSSILTKRKI